MKHRLERVKEVIKRELSEIIQREIAFQATLVTVQDVDITPDLKQCHVFIGAIGKESDKNEAIEKLEKRRAHLQRELAKRVVLKFTPQLHFQLDTSIERGVRVIELLETIEIPPDDEEPRNEE